MYSKDGSAVGQGVGARLLLSPADGGSGRIGD